MRDEFDEPTTSRRDMVYSSVSELGASTMPGLWAFFAIVYSMLAFAVVSDAVTVPPLPSPLTHTHLLWFSVAYVAVSIFYCIRDWRIQRAE